MYFKKRMSLYAQRYNIKMKTNFYYNIFVSWVIYDIFSSRRIQLSLLRMAGPDDSEALLRVHSKDLHEHIAQEVGECLESGLYTDLMIRCNNGQTLHGHKLVLSAVSPYLKWVRKLFVIF